MTAFGHKLCSVWDIFSYFRMVYQTHNKKKLQTLRVHVFGGSQSHGIFLEHHELHWFLRQRRNRHWNANKSFLAHVRESKNCISPKTHCLIQWHKLWESLLFVFKCQASSTATNSPICLYSIKLCWRPKQLWPKLLSLLREPILWKIQSAPAVSTWNHTESSTMDCVSIREDIATQHVLCWQTGPPCRQKKYEIRGSLKKIQF